MAAIFTPCHSAQTVYRSLLMAMSHPGRRYSIDAPSNGDDHALLPVRLAACLMDHEVSFALSQDGDDVLHRELARTTGAHPTDWDRADFLFVAGGDSRGMAATAKHGSLAYPDHGATLFYYLDGRVHGDKSNALKPHIRLSGPGIRESLTPELTGLSMEEYRLLRHINAQYPMGVDVFVVADNRYLMGLPRSTRIEVE